MPWNCKPSCFQCRSFYEHLHYTALLFTEVKKHAREEKVFHSMPEDSNRRRVGVQTEEGGGGNGAQHLSSQMTPEDFTVTPRRLKMVGKYVVDRKVGW